MKKTTLIAATLLGTALLAFAAPKKSATLLTVDGKPVSVAEFEYLRNKNNTQQQEPQSLDEYLDMFINFKLKVAAAEAAGLDTTATFRQEYETFCKELAQPYLQDKTVEETLVQESYDHMKEDVLVSHIMLAPNESALADSLRTAIVSGKANFEEVARQYSKDRGSNSRGGLMGIVPPSRLPWAFEKASYDTPVGGISEVVNSGVGLHIIRVESRTPASGEVSASHILLLTRNMPDALAARQKERIDSLYAVATAPGADFADLARRFSQDPGSAEDGGNLGYFGRGRMVQPFDSIAFALADGEISEPFKTPFGYHIILRTGHRGVPALEEVRENITAAIARDERANAPYESFITSFIARNKGGIDTKNLDRLAALVPAEGLDSASVVAILGSNLTAYKLGKRKATFADVLKNTVFNPGNTPAKVKEYALEAATQALRQAADEMAREELLATNDEYAPLAREYRDGILLYTIANSEVWEKASTDKEGLEDFFRRNKDRYKWDAPKFKSYIIFATNDSILDSAMAYADTLSTADPSKFTADMRERFGKEVKVERVIAAKGENAITDYLAFEGEKPEVDPHQKWKAYAAFNGRIIDAPEEAADVRGLAITDYQAELEKEWLERLHNQFKVVVNQKVLDGLRAEK